MESEAQEEAPARPEPFGLPVSVNGVRRWRPAHYGDAEGAPTYHLRAWAVRDRARFGDELFTRCGHPVTDEEVRAKARAAVPALPEDEQLWAVGVLDQLAEMAAQREALGDEEPDAATQAAWAQLEQDGTQLERELTRVHEGFARLLAQRRRHLATMIELAVQTVLAGWEGLDAPWCAVKGRPTTDTLDALPVADYQALGTEALRTMTLTGAQRGN